jgi:HEAT repeat protein
MINKGSFTQSKLYVVFLVVLILLSSIAVAQTKPSVVVKLNDNAISNLNQAIVSENYGLRKSAIYLVGKYSLYESSDYLLTQLKKEKDPSLRILIMRVLYIIGDEEFMDDIYKIASTDENRKVRKMGKAIYSMIQLNKSESVADLNR